MAGGGEGGKLLNGRSSVPGEFCQPRLGSAAASKMGWYLLPAPPPLPHPLTARPWPVPPFSWSPPSHPRAGLPRVLFPSLPVGEPAGGRARVCSELIVIIS